MISEIRNNFLKTMSVDYTALHAEPLVNNVYPTSFTPSAGPGLAYEAYKTGDHEVIKSDYCIIQPCLRYWDIPKVGDSSHLSFFEMAACGTFLEGNREKVLADILNFIVSQYNISKDRLWATYYDGGIVSGISEFSSDINSVNTWIELGIRRDHIVGVLGEEGFVANQMEQLGGYRTEIFFDVTNASKSYCIKCIPGYCTCGRFLEVATSVTYQFLVNINERKIEKISNFQMCAAGFGIERLDSIISDNGDIWQTSDLSSLHKVTQRLFMGHSNQDFDDRHISIITDNVRALLFLYSECKFYLPGKRNKGRRWILNKYLDVARKQRLEDRKFIDSFSKVIEFAHTQYYESYPYLSINFLGLISQLANLDNNK